PEYMPRESYDLRALRSKAVASLRTGVTAFNGLDDDGRQTVRSHWPRWTSTVCGRPTVRFPATSPMTVPSSTSQAASTAETGSAPQKFPQPNSIEDPLAARNPGFS